MPIRLSDIFGMVSSTSYWMFLQIFKAVTYVSCHDRGLDKYCRRRNLTDIEFNGTVLFEWNRESRNITVNQEVVYG
jgi:hypothetical protein